MMVDRRMERLRQTKQEWIDTKVSNQKLAYERKISRKLLSSLGLTPLQIRTYFNPSKYDPDEYMTFTWLTDNYTLPIRFVFGGQVKLNIRDMLKPRARTNALMKAWEEHVVPLAGNFRLMAMVFATPEALNIGDMVLHNYPEVPDQRETAVIYMPIRNCTLRLERVADFFIFLADKYGSSGD